MIVCVENAPKFNVHSNKNVTAYVDQFLTCSIDNPDVGHLIDMQVHKHSRTCRNKENKICHFGYPLPPLQKTMVLDSLEVERTSTIKCTNNCKRR